MDEWLGEMQMQNIAKTLENMIQPRVGMGGERKEEKRARYERARKKLSKN